MRYYCRPWPFLRHSRYIPHFSSSQATQAIPTANSIRRHKITSIKYAYRGGQNLSERYKRLEKSLRGKTAFGVGGNGAVIGGVGTIMPQPDNGAGSSSWKAKREDTIMFKGIEIPKEPKPPESDECCMSGCAVCVYDLYEEAMEGHRESINMVKKKLREMGVDKKEWPSGLDRESHGGGDGGRKNVVMDAFEQLERELGGSSTQRR